MEHEQHQTAVAVPGAVARMGACQEGGGTRPQGEWKREESFSVEPGEIRWALLE